MRAAIKDVVKASQPTEGRGSTDLARAAAAAAAAAAASDKKASASAAAQVFGPGGTHGADIHVAAIAPDESLRADTLRVIAALRRASYRGSDRSRRPSAAPPGRLHVPSLVQREVQLGSGTKVTATPWRETHRHEVLRPRIRLGLSIDVSGSMSSFQMPAARIGFALAHAVHALHGKVASTAWNSDVAPLLRPGSLPHEVQVPSCSGGSAGLPLSLRALDGALELTSNDTQVRMVVIVTDANLPDLGRCAAEVLRLHKAGVKVLMILPVGGRTRWVPHGVEVVFASPKPGEGTLDGFGGVIAAAVTRTLAKF